MRGQKPIYWLVLAPKAVHAGGAGAVVAWAGCMGDWFVRFMFRLASFGALCVAVIAATLDSIASVSASQFVVTPLRLAWVEIAPASLVGFRAFVDVVVEPGQLAEMRAFLRSGGKTLTETWSYPWRAEAQG